MLFLTATPFQLGHGELCSVLERFEGINWHPAVAPPGGREGFRRQVAELRSSLDAAQEASALLDAAWGQLRAEDLQADGLLYSEPEAWWEALARGAEPSPMAERVRQCYLRAQRSMKCAENLLRPWVIRHMKPRHLPVPHSDRLRRRRLVGAAILADEDLEAAGGIAIDDRALLPFLLAARATSCAPNSRPVFAEGLASSYEAFRETRKPRRGQSSVDGDDDEADGIEVTDAARWYLEQLERFLPSGDVESSVSHPKLAATVDRVIQAWRVGEKTVVFCHYVRTGQVLRQQISHAIGKEIRKLGAMRLNRPEEVVDEELERLGKRFFDDDSPIRRACDQEVLRMLERYPGLEEHTDDLVSVVRRNIRTPALLVRYFPLDQEHLGETEMVRALEAFDGSGLRLRDVLEHFFEFLVERCGKEERKRYIEAVKQVQTGGLRALDAASGPDEDERAGKLFNPTVRLVNGSVKSETRQRLMLTFNTPFYPEVLVASSVLAEGVDLHLNCRHVIHHDLCWNPSTLEQRTGRVDRIGAKAERCGDSIRVYLPFIAETQDEKMYRVVTDRERWFSVVMGENYSVDARTTEKLAARISLPEGAANALAFRLEVE